MVHQSWTLLRSYPDVLMGTIAGLLFVGVGISSARAARRRLRYETWYYLHFYTYLAIALAFSHQFADGAEFMRSAPARVFWATLYIAVFGSTRLVPDRRSAGAELAVTGCASCRSSRSRLPRCRCW